MTQKIPVLVLTCLFVVLPKVLATCPSKEDLFPCTCKEFVGTSVDVECRGINNEDHLTRVASQLRGMTVHSFTIEDSKFCYISHDAFKGVKLSQLNIWRSNLTLLTLSNESFVGLEDHLEKLFMWDCAFKIEWDWSVLRNFKKLEELRIDGSQFLETIDGEDLKKISVSSVKRLVFLDNNISLVSDHAFESFVNIEELSLHYNKIKNLKRTMLPNPALKLWSLDISVNLIEQLPEDMFTNMPELAKLEMAKNNIVVLDEKTFSPVWEQLNTFSISANPLHCDCRILWIVKPAPTSWDDIDINYNLYGKCASPPELEGKALRRLKSKDFSCNV